MKKKRMIISLSVFIIASATLAGGFGLWNYLTDYGQIIRLNWGLILPSDSGYTEIYSKDSGASFHGDGIRYHVFDYEEEKAVDTMVEWQTTEGKARFGKTYTEAVTGWLDSILVPDSERPEYLKCSFWYQYKYGGDEMIIMLDKSRKKLYIAEFFM